MALFANNCQPFLWDILVYVLCSDKNLRETKIVSCYSLLTDNEKHLLHDRLQLRSITAASLSRFISYLGLVVDTHGLRHSNG